MRFLLPFLMVVAATLHAAPLPPLTGREKPLFDGQSMTGWESPSPGLWSVRDGCLTGGDGKRVPHNDFLCTTGRYANFILRLKIKLTGDPKTGLINSGIQIRTERKPHSPEVSGFQCDYGEPAWFGAIYDEGRRNKLMATSDMAALRPALHPSDWDEYVIKADGPHIQTWLNGVQGVDYTEADPAIAPSGIIGIQLHSGGLATVQVKDVLIEELPGPVAAIAPPHGSPLSPQEELGTFQLPEGFSIELVAAEDANIGKFVCVDWDQHGRMWSQTAFEYPVDGNENMARSQALFANPGRDKVLVWDKFDGPGPHQPRVFTDGLALPVGILPWGNGVYLQHGPNIEFHEDTKGTGKADRRVTILSGFGVQDSHLFMHQFTRMPGNWIWAAQGAFNSGKVRTSTGEELEFDSTRLARFRPDGTALETLCTGPCNIWGLVVMPDGQIFIQESNDYGYPTMPFAIGGSYPGCADRLFKSYAPPFPGTARDFRMGGTGLSGLAFSDAKGSFPGEYASVMYVANPITRKINALKLLPEGPRWGLAQRPDFIGSSDPMFRPVAIHFGPDGALYIVDWYNKIISHNEVARNHPDRDKSRGRIWRVTHKDVPLQTMPDLTTCAPDELLRILSGDNTRQSQLAWQAITDRGLLELAPKLTALVSDTQASVGQRVRALWALEGLGRAEPALVQTLLQASDRNLRREAVESLGRTAVAPAPLLTALEPLATDPDPEVRAAVIRIVSGFETAGSARNAVGVGRSLPPGTETDRALALLIGMGNASLPGPMAPATRDKKPMRVGVAYEREFERYLVREALEQSPAQVAAFLASSAAEKLPVENRLLATLALEPAASAERLAALLPQAGRAPNDEELLRLAQHLEAPGVAEALQAVLQNAASRTGALEALLRVRSRLDAEKLTPMLSAAAAHLLAGGEEEQKLALQLIAGFQLKSAEAPLLASLRTHAALTAPAMVARLQALEQLRSADSTLFESLVRESGEPAIREAAVAALARSANPQAPAAVFGLWKQLTPAAQHLALDRLSTTPAGARSIVAAFHGKTLTADELDATLVDRLQSVLADDPGLAAMLQELGTVFRPVLRLAPGGSGYAETGVSLEGPFTVESWVRLDPGIGNTDGLLGSPGQLDMNFFASQFRVWAGADTRDAIVAQKKIVPDNWTHLAVTRDAQGALRIYIDGELDQASGKAAPQKFDHVRVGWAAAGKGTAGSLSEFRIWNRARTPEEIRNTFDRTVDDAKKPDGLVYHALDTGSWGKLHGKAQVERTQDAPPLLSPEEGLVLDGKFAKYRELAQAPGGDPGRGRIVAGLCRACHLIQGEGGNIAPNISGAGTMGVEALLRNIITPNAAIEAGYRLYRVEMKSGEVADGFFVSEDPEGVVIRMPGAPDRRIAKPEVRKAGFLRRSIMPEGILEGMTPEQVTDLFSYLMSLKG